MNTKQAYALRADAVYLMRGHGFKIAELAIILRVSKEKIRQLEARGRQAFASKPLPKTFTFREPRNKHERDWCAKHHCAYYCE